MIVIALFLGVIAVAALVIWSAVDDLENDY